MPEQVNINMVKDFSVKQTVCNPRYSQTCVKQP